MPPARLALPGFALGLLAFPVAQAAAPAWTVDPAQSRLEFTGTQQGEKFTGVFKTFKADILYGADDIADSKLEVSVDLRSVDSRSGDRDQTLGQAEWFDSGHQPMATFKSVTIRMTPRGPTADADLTIKGHSKRISFPFTFIVSGSNAVLDGAVTLNRLDFDLGSGEWADESAVGRKVDVHAHLLLHSAAAK